MKCNLSLRRDLLPVLLAKYLLATVLCGASGPVGKPDRTDPRIVTDSVRATLFSFVLDDGNNALDWVGDDGSGRQGIGSVVLHLSSHGQWKPFRLRYGMLSAPLVYRGPPQIDFYKKPPNPDEPANPSNLAASVQIPSDASDVLLVFTTVNLDKQQFNVIPIDYNSEGFPADSLRIINLSDSQLACRIGDEAVRVARRNVSILSIPPDQRLLRLGILEFDEETNNWKQFIDESFRHYRGQRYDAFVLANRKLSNEPLMLRIVTDDLQAREDTTKNMEDTQEATSEMEPTEQ